MFSGQKCQITLHRKQLQSEDTYGWLVGLLAPSLSWETFIFIDNWQSLLIFQQILICCYQVPCQIRIFFFCANLFNSFLKIKKQTIKFSRTISVWKSLPNGNTPPLHLLHLNPELFYHKILQLYLHLCILCIVSVPFFAVAFTGDHPLSQT